jgi:tetratricopeptide (TPR) repeat protein
MKHMMTWMATAATLTFALPIAAGQNDPRLPPLFDRLRVAKAEESRLIAAQIWQIWTASGNADIDRLMAVGIGAMAAERYQPALAAFSQVVKRRPGFAEGWNKRATVYYLLGDYEHSIEDVEKTLALEPRHFGALSGLGMIALALGEDERALDAFEAALEIYPHLPGAEIQIRALRDRLKGQGI